MPAKKAVTKTTKNSTPSKRVTSSPLLKKTSGAKSTKSKSQPEIAAAQKTAKSRKPILSDTKVRNSASFAKAESKAKEYAKNPKKLQKLFEDAAEKSKETPKGPFGETWAYLQAMIRLIRAYANGSYREIPVASLLMILVALTYFVSPIDFIPDFIPVVGFLDDALVISLALKQVKADLDIFMSWELETASSRA